VEDFSAEVIIVVRAGAERHARPDSPVLEVGWGRGYTPRQIAQLLEDGPGSLIWSLFDSAISHHSLQEVVESFLSDADFMGPAASGRGKPTPV